MTNLEGFIVLIMIAYIPSICVYIHEHGFKWMNLSYNYRRWRRLNIMGVTLGTLFLYICLMPFVPIGLIWILLTMKRKPRRRS
jgi:hypothetical protein